MGFQKIIVLSKNCPSPRGSLRDRRPFHEVDVAAPSTACAAIIGSKGSNIQEIKRESHCGVQVAGC